MHETDCSGLVPWDDPEGWDGEGGGRGGSGWGTHVNPWLIHINVWQKPLQYCKVISLQLKKKKKKNPPAMQETPVQFLGWEDPLEKGRWPTPICLGFPCGSAGKESACNVGDLGSIPGLGRSPGEGKGYPLQYSGLENSMDCIVHGVAKSQTRLSDFDFTFTSCLDNCNSLLTAFLLPLHVCLSLASS